MPKQAMPQVYIRMYIIAYFLVFGTQVESSSVVDEEHWNWMYEY